MLEIRIHGRGGQGAVTAAKALATAAAREDLFVQAFPEFGVERRGAPVCAYLRISHKWIYERGRIQTPDHALVLDTTLVAEDIDISEGLKPGGWIVLNSELSPGSFKKQFKGFKIATAKGNSIALSHKLGSKFAPFVNFPMLGAFIRAVPLVQLNTLQDAIREFAPSNKEENAQAAREAYNSIEFSRQEEKTWAEK